MRENRKIFGEEFYIFPYQFQNAICVLGTTTNVNPRNVVGYIHHIIRIPVLGNEVEFQERFTLTNEYSKIILSPEVSEKYQVKFRFASPVGNCQVKIWEYVPPL